MSGLKGDLPVGVGLGTFPFSNMFSPVDQDSAQEVVAEFLRMGGRYLETAPVYPVRNVDLGAILRGLDRDSYFVATKCVTGANSHGDKMRSGNPDFIRWQVEQELIRLGVERLDLLQAHAVPTDVEIEVVGATLQTVKDEGQARYIGVSNVDLPQLRRVAEVADISFVQNRFSLIHQAPHREIEQFCLSRGISLNPYQVIERGQLSSHPTDWTGRQSDDLRKTKHEYAGEPYHLVRAWAEKNLRPIAEDLGLTMETLVTAWALEQPAVGVCVVGATTADQVRNLHAQVRPGLLSQASLSRIDQAYLGLQREIERRYRLSVEEYRGVV